MRSCSLSGLCGAILVCAVAIGGCSSPGGGRPGSGGADRSTAADVAAIAAADERWLAAFNRADVEGMMALYAPDAIIMPDGEPTRVGREAIRLWQEDYFRRFSGRQMIDNEEIVAARDWAYMRGNWEVTLTPRDGGETVTERGKHLVIWRRQPDGSWLVARDMWNRS